MISDSRSARRSVVKRSPPTRDWRRTKWGGHEAKIRFRHLEVVPDDLVVTELQRGDLRGGPLLLQVGFQHPARVVLQVVKPVQLRVVTATDEVSLREECRRLVAERAVDQVDHLPHRRCVRGDPLPHSREAVGRPLPLQVLGKAQRRAKRAFHRDDVLCVSLLHGHPGNEALEVEHSTENLPDPRKEDLVPVEGFHRRKARLDLDPVQERGEDPAPQLPGAGRGAGLIEHGEERIFAAPLLEVREELEVALRGLVEFDVAPVGVDGKRRDVTEGMPGGLPDVLQQQARRDDLRCIVGKPEALEVGHAELPLQTGSARIPIEAPVRVTVDEEPFAFSQKPTDDGVLDEEGLLGERLPGIQAPQLPFQHLRALFVGEGRCAKLTGGHVCVGEGDAIPHPAQADEVIVRSLGKVAVVEHRPRGDHLHDVPGHETLASRRGVLLADRHFLPRAEKTGDVGGGCMVGDPAHGDSGAVRQGEIEQRRALPGVGVEHLVEITQTEKEDGIRVSLLDTAVLRHHWGCFDHGFESIVRVVGVGNTQTGTLLVGRDDRGIFLTAKGSIRAPLCYPLRESFLPQIDELKDGQSVFVDLSDCTYMDSTCIGILVAMDKKARKASGGRLHVLNPSVPCRASLEDIGLGGFFSVGEKTVAPPPVMAEISGPAEKPSAQFVLDAHEAFMETSEEAKKKFSALKDILQRALTPEKPPRDTP